MYTSLLNNFKNKRKIKKNKNNNNKLIGQVSIIHLKKLFLIRIDMI